MIASRSSNGRELKSAIQACSASYEAGVSDLALLSDCTFDNCFAECPTSQDLTACQSCLRPARQDALRRRS